MKTQTVIPAQNFRFSNDGINILQAKKGVPVEIVTSIIPGLRDEGSIAPDGAEVQPDPDAASEPTPPSGDEPKTDEPKGDQQDGGATAATAGAIVVPADWQTLHHFKRLALGRQIDPSVKKVDEADTVIAAFVSKA